jgi:hypothetical protein
MGRLADAGITNITWEEDEDGNISAEGLQAYDIDLNNELAIFHGEKCVRVVECESVLHAYSIAMASEAVCRWNIANGKTGNGHKTNERGWDLGGRA